MQIIEFIKNVLAWLIKNTALIVGILEAIGKVIAGIVSLSPTKGDDWLVDKVDMVISAIKKALYNIADKLNGKI